MVNIQKICWKAYLTPSSPEVSTDTLFQVFNGWIPGSEDIFIDVADYVHCRGGVKVILAGHYAHYYWDETDMELGLMYSRLKPLEGDNREKIKVSLMSFLGRLEQFRQDPRLKEQVHFDPKRLQFALNDRALAPNNEATFEHLAPLLTSQLKELTGGEVGLKHRHLDDPRRLFTVELSFESDLF